MDSSINKTKKKKRRRSAERICTSPMCKTGDTKKKGKKEPCGGDASKRHGATPTEGGISEIGAIRSIPASLRRRARIGFGDEAFVRLREDGVGTHDVSAPGVFAGDGVQHDGLVVKGRGVVSVRLVVVEDVGFGFFRPPAQFFPVPVVHRGLVPGDLTQRAGTLVLVDTAKGVAKLVKHGPSDFLLGRIVAQVAKVHRRLRLVFSLQTHFTQQRPAALLLETDADVGPEVVAKLHIQVSVLQPASGVCFDLMSQIRTAIKERDQ